MTQRRLLHLASLVLLFCAGVFVGALWVQEPGIAHADDTPAAAPKPPAEGDPPVSEVVKDELSGERYQQYSEERLERIRKFKEEQRRQGIPDLKSGLEGVPGMLKTLSANVHLEEQQVIFGWFEDKEAVKRWYYGDMHQKMLSRFFPDRNPDREALEYVPDDVGPVMVIASYTPAEKPGLFFVKLSIEIYTPLVAGFAGGGLFGPAAPLN